MLGDENKVIDYLEAKYSPHGARAYDLDVVEVCRELRKLREESRWIPVTERLPEDETDVLVWSSADHIEVGHYNAKSRSFVTHGYYTQSVTHWRPLPKPPEVGS